MEAILILPEGYSGAAHGAAHDVGGAGLEPVHAYEQRISGGMPGARRLLWVDAEAGQRLCDMLDRALADSPEHWAAPQWAMTRAALAAGELVSLPADSWQAASHAAREHAKGLRAPLWRVVFEGEDGPEPLRTVRAESAAAAVSAVAADILGLPASGPRYPFDAFLGPHDPSAPTPAPLHGGVTRTSSAAELGAALAAELAEGGTGEVRAEPRSDAAERAQRYAGSDWEGDLCPSCLNPGVGPGQRGYIDHARKVRCDVCW